MNFFHPPVRRGQDNLRARDYISDWRPPPKWDGFDQDRKRIDTETSHLSFNRPDTTTGWNYGRVVEGLNEMVLGFIKDVRADHVTADSGSSRGAYRYADTVRTKSPPVHVKTFACG